MINIVPIAVLLATVSSLFLLVLIKSKLQIRFVLKSFNNFISEIRTTGFIYFKYYYRKWLSVQIRKLKCFIFNQKVILFLFSVLLGLARQKTTKVTQPTTVVCVVVVPAVDDVE